MEKVKTEETTVVEKAPRSKKSKVFLLVLIILVLVGGWFGYNKYKYSQHHEDTDDAQVSANISPVIPRISGYVVSVKVKDNQQVKKGDTLLVLDDRDLKLKLSETQAALATAQSNFNAAKAITSAAYAGVSSSRASVDIADAQIQTAKVNVWRTSQDFDRYANLIKDHSVTQQQYEQALAAKQVAERQLQVLVDQKRQASVQTSSVASQSTATSQQIGVAASIIRQREVDVENAKLNLSYTVITSPEDGLVSKIAVQEGQYLQAGQSLFSIVVSNDTWVVANFKETQYNRMKVGQDVEVHADAFPGHAFKGRLTSFSPATGATFALLPPDNASGNFVKVVQRLPVKIEFADKTDSLIKLVRPGMNVTVDVHLN
ncbi:MAG: HlyD family secretion protein [Ginsengibacter sp.]